MATKKNHIAIFLIVSFLIISINVRTCFSEDFIDNFNNTELSNWDFIFEAENGIINCDSDILNIIASPLFQDEPESSMIIRKWIAPTDDVFSLSARLRISNFDRFAFSVDYNRVSQYSEASEMFGLHFRTAGGGYQILTINGKNGVISHDGIEGAILSNLQTEQWYLTEMYVTREPYEVTFTIKDDNSNLLAQYTEKGSDLSPYSYEDMKSVGFSVWTSDTNSLGEVDIDWVRMEGAYYPRFTKENNLIGYWSLNEGNGLVAFDSSGNNNDGVLNNGPSWTNGIVGDALSFDGVNDFVDCGLLADFGSNHLADTTTYSFWARTSQTVPSGFFGVANSPDFTTTLVIHFNTPEQDKFRFYLRDDNNQRLSADLAEPFDFTNTGWHHFAIVSDSQNNELKFYIDGVSRAIAYRYRETPASFSDFNHPLYIGAWDYLGGIEYPSPPIQPPIVPFSGEIDEVKVYNKPLTSTEIQSIALGIIHDIRVNELQLSSNNVQQGSIIDLSADMTNDGNQTETFDVLLNVRKDNEASQIIQTKSVTLKSGHSTSISFNWDTSNFDLGNYVMSVYVVPVEGELSTQNNILNKSIEVKERPSIIIDETSVSNERIDVDAIATIMFHAKWDDGSQVTNGEVSVNGIQYSINSSGWVSFESTSNIVQQKTWLITGVNVNGITTFTQNADNPSVIWDKINIELFSDFRVGVNEQARITFTGKYEFDETIFSGSITLNDTVLTQSTTGRRGYSVVEITDDLYQLTEFSSNEIQILFDELKISTQTETLMPGITKVIIELNFASDNTPVESGEVFVNNIKCTKVDAGKYQTNLSNLMPYQSFNVKIDVPDFSRMEVSDSVLPLGNIVLWVILVAILIVLLWFANKMRVTKNRLSKLKKLVNQKGKVTVEEIFQNMNLDLDSAEKLLHELAKQDDVDGSLTSDGKEFISSKRLEKELMRNNDEKD